MNSRRRRSAFAPHCAQPVRRRGRDDMSFVGRSVPRLEDRPLVTGQGRFAAVVDPKLVKLDQNRVDIVY